MCAIVAILLLIPIGLAGYVGFRLSQWVSTFRQGAESANPVNNLAEQFLHDIETRPTDFVVDQYTVLDKKTSFEWWFGNGPEYFGVYKPHEVKMPRYGARAFAARDKWLLGELIRKAGAQKTAINNAQ